MKTELVKKLVEADYKLPMVTDKLVSIGLKTLVSAICPGTHSIPPLIYSRYLSAIVCHTFVSLLKNKKENA